MVPSKNRWRKTSCHHADAVARRVMKAITSTAMWHRCAKAMKLRLVLSFALVLSRVGFDCFGQQAISADDSIPLRLATMARTTSHFSLTVLVANRPLRLWEQMEDVTSPTGRTNSLAAGQLRLAKELRALSGDRAALAALLKHADPKIRTLALSAIFQREDGRDLPLIATLINDSAETFPALQESMSSVGGSPIEPTQSVAHVAQAMLAFWGVLRDGRQVGMFGREGELAGLSTSDFAEYWKKYEGREHSASWFAVKMKRATRRTTPIQPEYRADIQRVVDEIRALPMPTRSWTQLYVLCPDSWFLDSSSRLATDEELITSAKALGQETLLRFLQRLPVTDDPDLRTDKANDALQPIKNFILYHAGELLRPEDADALLACEKSERTKSGVSPVWSIGAASVQPARAGEILRAALARETRSYVDAAGQLAGAMWRIRGAEEIDFLADWFFTAAEPMPQPEAFLWIVGAAGRSDTRELLAALVKHPRFEFTDWTTLKEILKITNADRPTPLVNQEDIYGARTGDLVDQKLVLATWRNKLSREYGLPEKSVTSSPSKAKRVLTQPAWTVPLADAPSKFVVSPDGSRLAMLTNGTITIWKSDTGTFEWAIPRLLTEAAYDMAFQTNGRLTVFDRARSGRFAEWDLTARQQTSQVLLTGRPHSGVDQGAYGFDGTAQRMGFAGYNHVACFDVQSGKAMWLRERGGGVSSLIALSSDGRWLASGGGSGNERVVQLREAGTGAPLRQFDEHAGRVQALAFSPDGRGLVTASTADGVRLW